MATTWDGGRILSLWWVPGTDSQLAGEISRANEMAQIAFVGTLSGSPVGFGEPEPPLLHGIGNQGPLFTARGLLRTGLRIGAPGFSSEVFSAQSLIVGAHVDEGTHYNEALLQATYLPDWMRISGILIDVTNRTGDQPGSVGVRYAWPPVQTCTLPDGTVITTRTSHAGQPSRSGYSVTENVALKITVPDALPVDDLVQRYIMPLLDLLSFATRHANGVDDLTIRSPDVTQDVEGVDVPLDLQFLTQWISQPPPPDDRLYPHKMNFALPEAPLGFQNLLWRWFDLHETLRPCFGPYFGLIYAPPLYTDLKLVSISQALESYHRATMPQHAMPKTDFKALKTALLAACPDEHRDFVASKLGHFNEITQVERTSQLVRKARPCLPELLDTRPTFAEDFIKARNARTHADASKTRFSPLYLYDLAQTGRYVFEACVMLDLGFGESECAALFQRQPEYQHYARKPVVPEE